MPKLSSSIVKTIEERLDDLFDRVKVKFLGPQSVARKLYISYNRPLSMPGLYENAVHSAGGIPDKDGLNVLLRTAANYLDATKLRAKGKIIKAVTAAVRNSENQEIGEHLEAELKSILDTVTSDVRRIIDTEAQQARGTGSLDGIVRSTASLGIEDPVVFFVVVRDKSLCDECKRLHLLDDNKTPRVYYLSEVGHGYHKKGDNGPCVNGLHPHCRCSLTTLLPGYGFTDAGRVTWKASNYSEIDNQRGSES